MNRLLTILLCLVCASARAATNTAVSCLGPDIQHAVDLSSAGDVVIIPAGQANITNTIVVTNAILVIGSGVGQTLLGDTIVKVGANTATEPVFDFEATNSGLYRITGIEIFKGTNGVIRSSDYLNGGIQFNGSAKAIRIDHCQFDQLQARAYRIEGCEGVIDHCSFFTFQEQAGFIGQKTPGDPWGDQAWTNAINSIRGTTNQIVIEDCYFQAMETSGIGKNCVDSQFGGSYTFRHNTAVEMNVGGHGTESGGRSRGTYSMEVYQNNFTSASRQTVMADIRSGTFVAWSNTLSGIKNNMARYSANRDEGVYSPWGGGFGLNPFDENDNTGPFASGTATSAPTSGQMSDSTATWTPNQFAGFTVTNQESGRFSAIFSNSATTLFYVTTASGNQSDLCYFTNGNHYYIYRANSLIDQPGRGQCSILLTGTTPTPNSWPSNALSPMYTWSNSLGGVGEVTSQSPHIRLGTEYFLSTSNGNYTPLVYPHPLVSASPSTPPSITLQPQSQTVVEHGPFTLTVVASGSGLTYQWYGNSGSLLLAGATTSAYAVSHTSAKDVAGAYYVAITNSAGFAISENATITMIPAAWWADDSSWSITGSFSGQ